MRRAFVESLLVIVVLAGYVHSQTFRGAINGTVTDPSGAVVPGASVKATDVATGIPHSTTTTSGGEFSFQDLPISTYKIEVSASGFQPLTVEKVSVTAGQIYTLPVRLSVGSRETTVEVSAAAVALDTTTVAQTSTIPAIALQNVPLNGRDFSQLIAETPGYGGYAVDGYGSLNGTRPNQMNWQIDGVDNNDFWHNIPAVNQGGVSGIAGVILPIDSVDEFSAQTQSNAEGGRNAGGTVNLVTKSGTNTFHGSVYYYNRNEFVAAASPFKPADIKKPELRNENYGFSVGGPIKKDKAFFFVTYEKQQYVIGLSGVATEPSAAWVTKAEGIMGGTPISPISQNLLANLWPSSITGLAAQTNNFFSPVASTGYSYNGFLKLDYNITDKHRLAFRGFNGQGSQTAPLGGSPALATASSNLSYYFETAPIHVQNYSLTLNSSLSPRLQNQLEFGINYFNQTFNDAKHNFDIQGLGLFLSPDAQIHGQPITSAPEIAISGFEQIGLTPPEGRNDITGQLTDIVSYSIGKHQLRFGGEVRQGRVDEFYFRHSAGAFNFTGAYPGTPWSGTCATGDPTCALADFLAGDVSSSGIAVGNAERQVRVNGFDLFMSDAWQLTRKLNLNLGLRYEYFGPLHSVNQDLAVFVASLGGIKIQGNGISSIFPADRNNFAPRFGFAYEPWENKNLVVRGGFGVFYDQINMNPFLDFRPPNNADGLEDNPAGPSPVSTYSTNRLGQTAYNWETVEGPSHSNPIFNGIQTCITGSGCAGGPFDVFGVSQNFRTPYFYNYSLNVEKGFGKSAVWQIGYVGSEGRKLSIMLNPPVPAAFPDFGHINELYSIGTSNYNALQSTFKIRTWHGLTAQFMYTWAHALDEISEYRGAIPLGGTNLKAEYGNSDFDTRNNFTTFLTYDIPGSSHGPKILTHGWVISSLLTFHGGQPYDEILPGLNLVPGANPLAIPRVFSQSGEPWINLDAFTAAPAGTLGDVRRNQYYGPGYADVDLSVFKNIPIKERFKLQLRAEMFNVFNRINLASGPGSLGSSTNCGSGSIHSCLVASDTIGDFNGAPGIGPGEPFNMQLAAKIIF